MSYVVEVSNPSPPPGVEVDDTVVSVEVTPLVFVLPAASNAYVFTQASPANSWVITHNLAYFPNVTTVDAAGHEIEGDVRYDSVNQVTVLWGAPTAGTAYLS